MTRVLRLWLGVLSASIGLTIDAGAQQPPNPTTGTTSFVYQGHFRPNSILAGGNITCDMQFSLFDLAAGGTQIGPTIHFDGTPGRPPVSVSDGVFAVTLDFDGGPFSPRPRVFDGNARWLDVEVRCPSGSGGFASLGPRSLLTATPYALSLIPGATLVNQGVTLTLARGSALTARVDGGGLAAITASGSGGYSNALLAAIDGPNSSAVLATVSGVAGTALNGSASGVSSIAVLGTNSSATSSGALGLERSGGIGVYGESDSGDAVYGRSMHGTAGHFDGKVDVNGPATVNLLQIRGGGDLAERFEVAGDAQPEPGFIVGIDPAHPGRLRVVDKPYDRAVTGIVSGANGLRPAVTIHLDAATAASGVPVAMAGRVYCWADATGGSIEPGDLLTSSDLAGHAMKVTDYTKAQGSIIGKAMSSLSGGRGLVLVVVTLQ